MKSIPKPTDDIETVYTHCISIVGDQVLKEKLAEASHLIVEAANELDIKVSTGEVYTIIRENTVNGNLSIEDLNGVYERMRRKGSPGRVFYDKLRLLAPSGKCPFCSQRIASQLDHYLPKTKYPRLSVVPYNLVPCCSDCNKSKLTNFPTNSDEEFLHPYYDNIENELWLKASIIYSKPPVFKFQVTPPDSWRQPLINRVNNYFTSLCLNDLYSIEAAVELTGIKRLLSKYYKNGGANKVRNFLSDQAESRSFESINSWQSAMYQAMSTDDWFCDGGFNKFS